MAEPDTDPVDQQRSARRVSASLHDLLFDRYADAVLVADADGRYVEANLAAAALLGFSRAEILERSIPDLVVGSERAEADFARFSAEGYWRGQVELRRKDGSTVVVEARATMLETADGTLAVSIVRESADPLEAALAASEAQFRAIVRSSNDAIFSEDPEGRIRTWNRAAERMFGYAESEIVGQHVSILAPPERRDEVQDNFERVWRGELVEHYETTRLAKDGRRVEVSLSVSPIKAADGTLTGIVAIARDVGDRHEAERRAHVLYELTHLLGRAASPHEVFDASMDALQRALHTDRASVLLFDDERVMRFRAWRGLSPSYRAAVEGHNPWSLEDHDPHPIHVPDVGAAPALEEVRGVIVHEGIRALTFVPLLHAGTLIGKFMLYFDAPRSLGAIDLQMATSIASQTAFAIERLRAEAELVRAHGQLELITMGSADGITIQGADGRVVYANEAAARLSGFDSVEAFLSDASRYANRWEILDVDGHPFDPTMLPGRRALAGEHDPQALLHIRDRETGLEYWREVRARTSTYADGARYAINVFHDVTEQRRAEERVRFVAQTLQDSLLPKGDPHIDGVELGKEFRTAGEGFDVGGDFYDVFPMKDGTWGVAVGDVCGKGPTAASLTGAARHTIRAGAMVGESPSGILRLVNDAILHESPEERFCTALVANLRPREGGGLEVRAASGGHPPALILRADGAIEEIAMPGTLLGLFEDPQLHEASFGLAPGDTMILYTDGVTDEQFEGEEFGEVRLYDLVRACAGCSPAELARRIVDEVVAFNAGPPRDDIAVIALRATR